MTLMPSGHIIGVGDFSISQQYLLETGYNASSSALIMNSLGSANVSNSGVDLTFLKGRGENISISLPKAYITSVYIDFYEEDIEGAYINGFLSGSGNSVYSYLAIERVELRRLKKLGTRFGATSFNSQTTIDFGDDLEEVGSDFLREAHIVQPVILPASLRRMGQSFMSYCDSFTGPLYIPEGVPAPDDTALLCHSNSVAAAGVVITGPGASTWKEALPDRTGTATTRKLILAQD